MPWGTESLPDFGTGKLPPIDPTAQPAFSDPKYCEPALSHSRKGEKGILLPREPGGLDVKVSERKLDRVPLYEHLFAGTASSSAYQILPVALLQFNFSG